MVSSSMGRVFNLWLIAMLSFFLSLLPLRSVDHAAYGKSAEYSAGFSRIEKKAVSAVLGFALAIKRQSIINIHTVLKK